MRRRFRRAEGELLGEAGGLFARRQDDRRRTEPGVARAHCIVGRHTRMNADQHVFRDHRAVRHVGAVADEAAPRNHRRPQDHPAAVDGLVAEHHGIGDERLVAQGQQVGDQPLRRRDFGAAPDPGAEQAIPERRIDRRVDAVQDVETELLDLVRPASGCNRCCRAPASALPAGAAGRSSAAPRRAARVHTISTAVAGKASRKDLTSWKAVSSLCSQG